MSEPSSLIPTGSVLARGVVIDQPPRRPRPVPAGLRVERFEWVTASESSVLIRLAARWAGAAPPLVAPTLLLGLAEGSRQVRPLPDPSGYVVSHRDGALWRLSFPAPLGAVRGGRALFGLQAHAGLLLELPAPTERALLEPRLLETVMRRRTRPYALVSIGLAVAALSPVSLFPLASSRAAEPPAAASPYVVRSDCPPTHVLADGTRCLPPGEGSPGPPDPVPVSPAPPTPPTASSPGVAPPAQAPSAPAPAANAPARAPTAPAQGKEAPPKGDAPAGRPAPTSAPPKAKPKRPRRPRPAPGPRRPGAPRPRGHVKPPAAREHGPAPHRPASPPVTKLRNRLVPVKPLEPPVTKLRNRLVPVKPLERFSPPPRTATPRAPAPPAPAPGSGPAAGSAFGPLAPPTVGVPNFLIDNFRIPPFLLPIYQAAGTQYGVPWQVLAGINEIETDYGRNLNVSSAGARGWMQFMPATWATYGVDANSDHRRDPYNPVDAIFAAARYLRAAGAQKDVRRAIFAYNHAGWYVDSVMLRAKLVSAMPDDLVGALTGLTQGHFPVAARARYAGQAPIRGHKLGKLAASASVSDASDPTREGIDIAAKPGSAVVAVNDGVVVKIGRSARHGRFVVLRDVYGNRFLYAGLGRVARFHPTPRERKVSDAAVRAELKLPAADPKPKAAASAGVQRHDPRRVGRSRHSRRRAPGARRAVARRVLAPPVKERLFAHPSRRRARAAGGERQLGRRAGLALSPGVEVTDFFSVPFHLRRDEVVLRRLRRGSRVIGGTVLGRLGEGRPGAPAHVRFAIRPAGHGAPVIDPKPILDGWRLLESTAIYRTATNPFFGPGAKAPSIGQIMLMSKEALERRVLADPRISIYACGRQDVAAGAIDRRVLATLEFLAASGFHPTVTALECGHSFLTASGNVSEHSSGDAVDIGAINGVPITGHQGPGSITETTIRRLLTLQGAVKPHQIISLMAFQGADNTLSMADHYNHIHLGFRPLGGSGGRGEKAGAVLKPSQWAKLVGRLSEIRNPIVPIQPSRYAIKVTRPRGGRGKD